MDSHSQDHSNEQHHALGVDCYAEDPSPGNSFYETSGLYHITDSAIDSMLDTSSHNSSEVVVDSVFQGDETAVTFSAANFHYQPLDFHQPSKNRAKRSTSKRQKHPPPSNETVVGYHENDVLNGRGAIINAHPGNVRFRTLCIARKLEFDNATNSHKRLIAESIVEEILGLDPPGRFLERVDNASATAFEEQHLSCFDGEVDIDRVLTGRSAEYFKAMGYTVKNKAWMKHIGPWKHFSIEKAIQKACGVIRDHKRPDKIALRMSRQKKKNAEEDTATENESCLPVASALHDETIIPTCNDVLIGRGAFINTFIGNMNFRKIALQHKEKFDSASGSEKRSISLEIVLQMNQLDPPGRFLKRPSTENVQIAIRPRGIDGPWEEVSIEKACAKVCQSMRDLKQDSQAIHSHDEGGIQQELASDNGEGLMEQFEHASSYNIDSHGQVNEQEYMIEDTSYGHSQSSESLVNF